MISVVLVVVGESARKTVYFSHHVNNINGFLLVAVTQKLLSFFTIFNHYLFLIGKDFFFVLYMKSDLPVCLFDLNKILTSIQHWFEWLKNLVVFESSNHPQTPIRNEGLKN